ncbi:hypothetical protein PENVUL_c009G06705 [Penicillium vulpinum]|uniref:Uncharacterized protein n=1 Tax=Penicillium vulpinum TaxID=29845 RepID=A0A1V6S3S5_9EURO|nr:hypothetical protein PENVUL_c009G06705 [Penicillium vulpinum]
MDRQDQYDELMARLNALASREADLRDALYANMISTENTNNELRILKIRAYDQDKTMELEVIQEGLREQEVQLTVDHHHACSQCAEVESLLNLLGHT